MRPLPSGKLVALLLIGLSIRLAWALIQPSDDGAIDRLPDQREYLSLGQSLVRNGTLRFIDPRFDQPIYAYRTPGYPAFVALCGASPPVIRVIQAFLDTSTILAVYLLARQLSGSASTALWAAGLVVVNPFLNYFCGLILSETLFIAALAWAILLLTRGRTIAGGIVMLLAVLIRPSALALAPIVAAVSAFTNPPSDSSYRFLPALRRAAIVTAIILIGLTPWAYRNHRMLGSWIWTTTNAGVTLYDGFHPAATGGSDQRFLAEMPQLRSMNEVDRSTYLSNQAKSWATENAAKLPGLTLTKIARMWSPMPLSAEFGQPMYRLISAAYALPFDLLVIAGLLSRGMNRSIKLMLLTPAIYFTIVHALSVGSLRYRVPVEPELAVLAAIGATFIIGATRLGTSSQTVASDSVAPE